MSSNRPVSVNTPRQRCGCNWQFLLWPFPKTRKNSRSQKLLCSEKVSAYTHIRRAIQQNTLVQFASIFFCIHESMYGEKSIPSSYTQVRIYAGAKILIWPQNVSNHGADARNLASSPLIRRRTPWYWSFSPFCKHLATQDGASWEATKGPLRRH